MIAHVTDYDSPGQKQYPVAYLVVRGELKEGVQRLKTRDMFEADLIIIVKDGSFYVWKDRNGERGPVTFKQAWEIIEAHARAARKHRNELKNPSGSPRR